MKLLVRNMFIALLCVIALAVQANEKDIKVLEQRLAAMFPGETGYKISATPVKGLYEVDFGNLFMYLSSDGQFAFKGDIINVTNGANLTEQKRSAARLEKLSLLSESETIVYPSTSKQKLDTLTVFTDIDCSYCRKLHREVADYNRRGIEVRYVFFPRAGIGSTSYDKAVSVWCSKDRRKALDTAKALKEISAGKCDNPVLKHIEIAGELGVSSTPVMFTSRGDVIPGYLPAVRLQQELLQLNRAAIH